MLFILLILRQSNPRFIKHVNYSTNKLVNNFTIHDVHLPNYLLNYSILIIEEYDRAGWKTHSAKLAKLVLRFSRKNDRGIKDASFIDCFPKRAEFRHKNKKQENITRRRIQPTIRFGRANSEEREREDAMRWSETARGWTIHARREKREAARRVENIFGTLTVRRTCRSSCQRARWWRRRRRRWRW